MKNNLIEEGCWNKNRWKTWKLPYDISGVGSWVYRLMITGECTYYFGGIYHRPNKIV